MKGTVTRRHIFAVAWHYSVLAAWRLLWSSKPVALRSLVRW